MTKDKICAVVFDMDGVLFDSERITRIMWKKAGEEFHVDDVENSVKDCTGRNISDTCVYLKNKYGENFPAYDFRMRCSELFHSYVDEFGLPLMPYAREILLSLKKKSYVLALASSTRKLIAEKELKEAGLYDFFTTVTCGDMVKHSKPDPEIYLYACSSLGFAPENCVAVEDSPNGIISAYSAGMKCVMVPDQIEPDEEIKSKLFMLCSSLEDLDSHL